MANPFRFAAPVQGEYFAGRRREKKDLADRLTDGLNVAVVSPRRFGKTSLINEVCARVARGGATVVRTNAMLANDDAALFASGLVSAVYHSSGPWRRVKDSLSAFLGSFAQFAPTVSVGPDGPSFSFAATSGTPAAAEVVRQAYGLLATATRPVLVIDEFQELTRLPGNVPGVFKALADAHSQVALVVAGSKQHMMDDLTADARGPLYGMMYRLDLAPVPAVEMADFVERRFNVGGKPISRERADRIVELAGPVPNDIQHLAYDVYAGASAGREVTDADVEAGLSGVVDQAVDGFLDTFTAMTGNQRRLLVALAATPTDRVQAAEFVRRTGYANPSGVARGVAALREAEIVARWDGRWQVVHPFLRRWLAAQQG